MLGGHCSRQYRAKISKLKVSKLNFGFNLGGLGAKLEKLDTIQSTTCQKFCLMVGPFKHITDTTVINCILHFKRYLQICHDLQTEQKQR